MVDETFDAGSNSFDGTIEIVSALVSNSNNRFSSEELQSLIRDTFATLSGLTGSPVAETADDPENHTKSKAEIRKSIGTENLISFEDGRPYKSLKRHLTIRGLSPADYRAKYGLPADYPMTHPDYSARRSELAKAIGLGSKGRQAKAAPTATRKTRKSKTTAVAP